MNKKDLIKYVSGGDVAKFADKLEYNIQTVYNMPNVISASQRKNIVRRLKAARITVPKELCAKPAKCNKGDLL